ncbi:hypothetical protein [Nocardia sp. XZ_19_385]|uniref:hypothetical protein n=1 Tax=Nocardia sp. XZ_19_385 TaxID=2769488 RepID=UPI00188E05EA|nr:hypothetical protein [Nocardia sp. XZ_19_385]
MLLPTPTAAQFRKATASSPQQACVMVYRDNHRTLIWDDKLAGAPAQPVPLEECLVLDHAQFEALQEAIRSSQPSRGAVIIIQKPGGLYEFSASAECIASVGTARLSFDHLEYTAFVHAVLHHEFEQSTFLAHAH